jgi:FAD binding domain
VSSSNPALATLVGKSKDGDSATWSNRRRVAACPSHSPQWVAEQMHRPTTLLPWRSARRSLCEGRGTWPAAIQHLAAGPGADRATSISFRGTLSRTATSRRTAALLTEDSPVRARLPPQPHSGPVHRARDPRACGAAWLPGAVRRPSMASFDDVRPQAVVRCRTPQDVAQTIRFARRHGISAGVRSGGRCFAGRSTTPGAAIPLGRSCRPVGGRSRGQSVTPYVLLTYRPGIS